MTVRQRIELRRVPRSEQVAAVMEQHSDWMKAGSVSQRRGVMLMMTGKAQAYPDGTLNIVKLALDDTDSKVRSIGVQLIRQLLPAREQLHNRLLELVNDRNEEPAIRNSILRLMALVPGDALATETALVDLILAEGDDPDSPTSSFTVLCEICTCRSGDSNLN